MKTIKIKTGKEYNVLVGNNLLNKTGEFCEEIIKQCKTAIITDDNVSKLYLKAVKNSLKEKGYKTVSFIFKAGEASKNINTLSDILEFLAENQMTRGDIIIALGGGVTGDITGLAAAVYLRGIKFIQIPTTLLAQVDSSVGGKTAIDLKAGKNLAGCFYQPELVICDTDALKTLKPSVFSEGMAEVIKYGMIFDKNLLSTLEREDYNLEDVIGRCIILKSNVVEKDEFDNGDRQLLNFGHTIGHAIEQLSRYKISHGEAVAIGMIICAKASFKSGFSEKDYSSKLLKLLKKYNLPYECKYSVNELTEACLVDKKRKGNTLTLIVPKKLGECILHNINVNELQKFVFLGCENDS